MNMYIKMYKALKKALILICTTMPKISKYNNKSNRHDILSTVMVTLVYSTFVILR